MLPPYQKCIAPFMSSRNDIGFEIEIRNMRGMCAEYGQRMSKEMEVVRRYTGGTIEIQNSWLVNSVACGRSGGSLSDKRYIPLALTISSLQMLTLKSNKNCSGTRLSP